MRACATAPSQRSVPTLSMPIWPDGTTISPASIMRLKNGHGAIVEEEGVGVVGRTAEEFHVPRLHAREALLEAGDQRVRLQHAHLKLSKVV